MLRAPVGTNLEREAEREEDRVEPSRGVQRLREQRRHPRRWFFISDAVCPPSSLSLTSARSFCCWARGRLRASRRRLEFGGHPWPIQR